MGRWVLETFPSAVQRTDTMKPVRNERWGALLSGRALCSLHGPLAPFPTPQNK